MQDWKDLDLSIQFDNTRIMREYLTNSDYHFYNFLCEYHGSLFFCDCLEYRKQKIKDLEFKIKENIEWTKITKDETNFLKKELKKTVNLHNKTRGE